MTLILASAALTLGGVYGLIGLSVALRFIHGAVDRRDAAARGAGAGFRLLILPGCVLLWPLLMKWMRAARPVDGSHT